LSASLVLVSPLNTLVRYIPQVLKKLNKGTIPYVKVMN
jgi:hypothetical protein